MATKANKARAKRSTQGALKKRTLCDGNVVLFKRDRSRRWQCRVKDRHGKWTDYSTRKDTIPEAKAAAIALYESLVPSNETNLVSSPKPKTRGRKRQSTYGKVTDRGTLKERTLCEGSVVLYRRQGSARWQCRIRRHTGIWVNYSTKEQDFDNAVKAAEERFRDIKYRQETGKIDVTRRFSDVCKVARRELLIESENSGRILPRQLTQVIDKYLIPLLGTYQCHNITRDVLREFSRKRAQIMGKVPTQSTIATHNTALNYVLRKAHNLNYLEFVPKLINDGDATRKRRSYFTDKELRQLNNFMWRDLEASKKLYEARGRNGLDTLSQTSYEIRQLLRDVVLILVNSGIRPGDELLKLKWNNLDIVKQDEMESIRFSLPHTKTKIQRVVIGYEPKRSDEDAERYGCWKPLERIAQRFDDLKNMDWNELFTQDEYIFRLPLTGKVARQEALTKNFKKLLKRCPHGNQADGLLKDDFGNERVLYSLRHTYASRRRYASMSFDDLSIQMGTSVKMLEEHYSHFTVSDNPNLFSGHAKRQQNQKDDENAVLRRQMNELLEQNRQLLGMLAEK